jgi:hypothetical protein
LGRDKIAVFQPNSAIFRGSWKPCPAPVQTPGKHRTMISLKFALLWAHFVLKSAFCEGLLSPG